MKWTIAYKHTFGCDVFEGSEEDARKFAVETLKKDLEGLTFPNIVDCGYHKEVVNCFEDLIEEIYEYTPEEEDGEVEEDVCN